MQKAAPPTRCARASSVVRPVSMPPSSGETPMPPGRFGTRQSATSGATPVASKASRRAVRSGAGS
eukprot:13652903-Alexandrium_andersonii.AAC.1